MKPLTPERVDPTRAIRPVRREDERTRGQPSPRRQRRRTPTSDPRRRVDEYARG